MSEPIRRVKLYRAGKLWVAAAVVTFGVGVATGVGQVAGWQAQTVQAADDATTIVTTKDDHGNFSIDPEHTAGDAVAITDENMAQYFTVSDLAGNLKTISGREVSLTTGKEATKDESGHFNFTQGSVLLLANRQVDFTSDFALSVTMHVAYDNSLGTWVGGDGTALFFEPLSVNDVIEDAEIGSGLGIAYADYVKPGNLISFNISSNAEGRVTAPGGTKYTPARWLVYSSSATISKSVLQKTAPALALDTPIETNQSAGKEGETVKRVDMAYTFDMKYDAKGHTITTNVLDGADKLVQTWKFTVPDAWRGKGYTMGVSAATAMSKAQFDATINSYSYTPAGSSLNISSTGLPEGVIGPKQSDIKASAGNTVAFYPEGTQAPTTGEDGRPLTAAYAVPAVGDYGLAATQYATIVTGDDNNVVLPFVKRSKINVEYVDQNGKEIQPSTTLTGNVGTPYSVTQPTIEGYTEDGLGKDSPGLTGKFIEEDQTVTLQYKQNAGSLTIKYEDEAGHEIADPIVKDGSVGEAYQVDERKIPGYGFEKLKDGSAALEGTLTVDAQTVTLVYHKLSSEVPNPVDAGPLTIHYVDEYGATIESDETKAGNVGNGYTIEPPKIGGYHYGELGKDSAPLTGAFTKDPINITLVYNQNEHKLPDPVAASLTIHYVDEYGATIKSDEIKAGNVGNGYTVVPKPIGGYTYAELGKDSASLTGEFTKDPTNITLVYNQNEHKLPDPVAASLTIHYVDEYGATIRTDETKTGNVGNGYAIVPPEIGGYHYGELGKDSAPLTGQFTKDPTDITLVYNQNEHKLPDPVAASLTIHYVDEYGATIRTDETKTGNVGNGYAIVPPEIGGYHYGELGKDSAPLTGQFTKDPTDITLVYNQNEHKLPDPVAASLTIHYVDEYGATIKHDEAKAGNVGNGYAIVPPEIGGYRYGELCKDSAPLTGQFAKGPTNITLVYNQNEHKLPDPIAASLTIHYVDEYGATIKSDETKAGNVGNSYTVVPPEIGGYHYGQLGKDSAPLTGTFTKDPTNITLVYNQNEHKLPDPVAASLTIHYVDKYGATIKHDETKTGNVGNGYAIVPPEIGGYQYAELDKDSAPLTGQFTKDPTNITLVYNQNEHKLPDPIAASLTIHYVDEYGATIKSDETKTGNVGNGYTVVPKLIGGYTYTELGKSSAPLTGQFSAQPTDITLVYHVKPSQVPEPIKAGELRIHFVDIDGKPLGNDIVKTGSVGNGYTVAPIVIDGYRYVGLADESAPLTGTLSAEPQTITLLYRPVPVTTTGTGVPGGPVDNGGNPPSTPVDNGGNPPSTPVDNGGNPPSTPVDNGGNPPNTPVDNGGTAPSTPVDNGGNPPSTPIDNGGNPPSTPVDNGGTTPSTPVDNGGNPPSTPIDNGGNPPSTPVDNGGTTPSTPVDNGGTAPSTPVDNGGNPPSTPIDNGGTAPSTPVDNGGNPPSTPNDNGGNPPSTPVDNGGNTTPLNNNGNATPSTPIDNGNGTQMPNGAANTVPTTPTRLQAQPAQPAARTALPDTNAEATPTSAGKAAVQQPSRKATRQALPQTGDHTASMLALLGAFLLGIVGLTGARRDE